MVVSLAFIAFGTVLLFLQLLGVTGPLFVWALASSSALYLLVYYTVGYMRSENEHRGICASSSAILLFITFCALLVLMLVLWRIQQVKVMVLSMLGLGALVALTVCNVIRRDLSGIEEEASSIV